MSVPDRIDLEFEEAQLLMQLAIGFLPAVDYKLVEAMRLAARERAFYLRVLHDKGIEFSSGIYLRRRADEGILYIDQTEINRRGPA